MLQSSITAWLKKPASIKKNEAPIGAPNALVALPTPQKHGDLTKLNSAPIIPKDPTEESQLLPVKKTESAQPIRPTFGLQPLPPNVELAPLTEEYLPAFKQLNAVLLPIPYPAQFYTETMTQPHHSVTLVALWHPEPLDSSDRQTQPKLIGAIRCRVLQSHVLYISTIGILSPYRSYGIATHLLHRIAAKAAKEHGSKYITAHVWEANEDALEWYGKRAFEVIGREEGYYSKLRPSGAFVIKKVIGVGDMLEG